MSEPDITTPLRSLILRGGVHLGVRQLLGLAINITGVFLLTRTIGPSAYGRYAAALGLFYVIQLLAQLGIGVYLVRSEVSLARRTLDQAATLFALLGIAGLGTGALFARWFDLWTGIDGVGITALVLLVGLPFVNVGQVAIAQLDRALAFKRSAWIELTGQALFYVIAIPLALKGAGSWAVVAGWWVQQITLITGSAWAARYVPRIVWDPALARDMLGYGLSFSASLWIYQLRRLINPIVVGRYLGAEAVGIVSLCTQLVTHLGFMGVVGWRIATASFARIQADAPRMLRAIRDGMWLQLFAVGPLLLLFAWAGPAIVPALLGRSWTAIADIFPFIAVGYLINSLFNFHGSALYVIRRNLQMGVVHLTQLVLLTGIAFLLVPRFGLLGYGLAELATLLSYPLLHAFLTRHVGTPTYTRVLPAAFAFALALFWRQLGPVSLLGLIALALVIPFWPETRRLLAELRTMVVEL